VSSYATVGKGLPRVGGVEQVTGEETFCADIFLKGMLHAKILRSPHPHARILNIDTSRAEKLPGVPAIVNAIYQATGIRIKEVPVNPEEILKGLEGREN